MIEKLNIKEEQTIYLPELLDVVGRINELIDMVNFLTGEMRLVYTDNSDRTKENTHKHTLETTDENVYLQCSGCPYRQLNSALPLDVMALLDKYAGYKNQLQHETGSGESLRDSMFEIVDTIKQAITHKV